SPRATASRIARREASSLVITVGCALTNQGSRRPPRREAPPVGIHVDRVVSAHFLILQSAAPGPDSVNSIWTGNLLLQPDTIQSSFHCRCPGTPAGIATT